MYADFAALSKNLAAKLQMYKYNNEKQASMKAIASLLSRTLYYKRYSPPQSLQLLSSMLPPRFFPYYTFNLLAGFDENGRG